MKGLILTNAYVNTGDIAYQPNRLKEEFEILGVEVDVKPNDFFPIIVDNGKLNNFVSNYDFCIFLDKDKYVLKGLEKTGMKIYNAYEPIIVCDDKMLTFIRLANEGVSMPKTLPSPIMYVDTKDDLFLDGVEKELNYPIVVKNVYGSMGKGVYLAENRNKLDALFDKLKLFPHLYQEYIGEGFGKDIRVIVVDNRVICSMERENKEDFRSNIGLGGKGREISLTKAQEELALRSVKLLGLDYAGVDIISKEGKDYICEVNSNAFFKEIEEVTGKNVAKAFATCVFSKIYKN